MNPAAVNMPAVEWAPEQWHIVQQILMAHVPQLEVWAFGSRARRDAKPYSDLDLAIITSQPLPLAVSAALADEFSRSDLPWRVDVLDWATTGTAMQQAVARDKVVLQEPRLAG